MVPTRAEVGPRSDAAGVLDAAQQIAERDNPNPRW